MFHGYDEPLDEDQKELVILYEKLVSESSVPFFDSEQFELIADFYLQTDQFEKAREVISIALHQYPYSSIFLIQSGHLKIYDNQIDEALEIAEKIRLIEPFNSDVYLLFGNAYDAIGQYEEAISFYQQAIEKGAEKDDVYLFIAYSYQNWDKYGLAVEALKKALIFNNNNSQALGELAFCCDFIEETSEIKSFVKAFIDDNPYSYMAWYCLGSICCKNEELDEAIESFDYAVVINEQYLPAQFNLGSIYLIKGENEKAINCFKSILEINPDDIFALCNMANAFKNSKNWQVAREYFKKALKVDASYSDAWHGLGLTYQEMNHHKTAIEFFNRAIKLDKDDFEFWYSKARSCQKLNQTEDAYTCYAKAFDLDEGFIPLVEDYSCFLMNNDMPEEARHILDVNLNAWPDELRMNLLMGGLLIRLNKAQEAILYLAEAKELDAFAYILFSREFPDLEGHPIVLDVFKYKNPE